MRCKFDLRGEIEDIIYQFSIKDVSIKSILHEILYAEKSLDTLIHHHDNDWIESLYCNRHICPICSDLIIWQHTSNKCMYIQGPVKPTLPVNAMV